MNTKSGLVRYGITAAALMATYLLALPAAPQTKTAAAKSDATAKSDSSGAYMSGCCGTNEELQKFYLGLPVAKKPTPRAPDGHPDLSGFYDNPFNTTVTKDSDGTVSFTLGGGGKRSPYKWPTPDMPSYKPEYAAKVEALFKNQYGASTPDDPQYDCKPMGVPRASMVPLQFVQTPKMVVVLYESNFIGQTYRIIYTDGRGHPKDLDSSFLGDSIGHWEGDTLVVDVTGLNDETWLGGAQGHTEPGGPGEPGHQIVETHALIHSDQEHVTERYTRHGDMLVYEATVEDPVMFARPWVLTPRHFMLGVPPDDRIFESFCEARDKSHIIRPSEQDQPQCELGNAVNKPGDPACRR
jgi:hypothetical protein